MPKLLKILADPNPVLRKKSEPVEIKNIKNRDFKKLCQDMVFTMLEKDGIGLAASQIGKNIRLIVINTKDKPIALINPKIKSKSILKEWGEEGCLSVPGYFGQVKRNKNIKCVFINEKGETQTITAIGLMARVIQHEIDHLDGILFIDKAKQIAEFKK